MADIGYGALLLVFLAAGYALVAFIVGLRRRSPQLLRSAENGLAAAAIWTVVASLILLYLLLSQQYQVVYVYEHVSSFMRLEYVLSAFWAGQQGSLLLWLLLISIADLILIFATRDAASRPLRPYLLATLALIQVFMALVLIFPSNPFEIQAVTPPEGFGLNPLLENFGMVFHPPTLFIGYALYAAPFAFVIAGLLSGQMNDAWIARTRRWSLIAWVFLSVGILLGAWWAYVELGWGGYWAWDPVENSSLIPWLVGTAALHSAAIQARRGIFRVWTAALNLLTFILCIFATFVTRSGIIQSVHAFERSSIGTYFAIFLIFLLVVGFGLLVARRRLLAGDIPLDSLLSREAGFLLTNLLLVGAALVVFLGTIFPAITELLRGAQTAMDPSFFNRAFLPLAFLTVLLFGICPFLGWGQTRLGRLGRRLAIPAGVAVVVLAVLFIAGVRKALALVGFAGVAFVAANIVYEFIAATLARARSTGENPLLALARLIGRDRRRYGGMIVHLSILLIALGVVGSGVYKTQQQVSLQVGEELQIGGYTLKYVEPVSEQLADKERYVARLEVNRGRLFRELTPEKNFHNNIQQWVSEVAVWSRPAEDFYVSLGGLAQDGSASLEVLINPLMLWMWVGGGVLVLGVVIAWWPAAARSES
jgi:cytochrome c-type biogenesis protein CcmF